MSIYFSYNVVYLCIKSLWYLSYLCSFQGLFFLCLLNLSYNYFTSYIDSYLYPMYDYFEIRDSVPSRKDIFIYTSCSVINCEHPVFSVSQMLLGWKSYNKTFISELSDIDISHWIQLFGKSIGKGMVHGFQTNVYQYLTQSNDKTSVQYLEN
jgi:hypothetical protein